MTRALLALCRVIDPEDILGLASSAVDVVPCCTNLDGKIKQVSLDPYQPNPFLP